MTFKRKAILLLSVISLIALLVLRTVWLSGAFKTITNSFVGSVVTMEGFPGVEDIDIDQNTGIAFLSSDDRWARMLRNQQIKGAIYTLNLNDSTPTPVNATLNFPQEDFHPHGISFYQSPDGKKMLFVVNHRQEENFIEIFQYRNDSLLHLESITDPLIISPNDVVGVGERSFYFTNDHNEKAGRLRSIKDLLMIGTGNVGYFDGKQVTITSAQDIKYANGVNISRDGKDLYLAASSDKKIIVYHRDLLSGALTLASEIETGTGVDNIDVDADGNLWVGCHPQLLKFLAHSKKEGTLSPSEIIKLTPIEDGKFKQETIYMNDGSEISASSVAAVYGNILLVGGVFERRFLMGRMGK